MFEFGNKSRIKREIKELHITMVAQAIKFTTGVTDNFDGFIGQHEKPSYRLLFSQGAPTVHSTHLNQFVLAMEGMAFFLHSLSRMSFRPNNDKLRETVFDPSVHETARLFGKMFGSLSDEIDAKAAENCLLDLISKRELEYAQMPSLLGKTEDDRQSAVSAASSTIAESVGRPKHAVLYMAIRLELLRAFTEMDLVARVKRIEAIL